MNNPKALLEVKALKGEDQPKKSLRKYQSAEAKLFAAELLTKLGATETTITTDESGAPLWPNGYSGSLSHCVDETPLVAAYVSSEPRLIGVDIEPVSSEERTRKVAKRILSGEEQEALHSAGIAVGFSAKEALYKALNPACGFWFGFFSVSITDVAHDSLTVKLTDPRLLAAFGSEVIPIEWKKLSVENNNIILTSLSLDANRYKCL